MYPQINSALAGLLFASELNGNLSQPWVVYGLYVSVPIVFSSSPNALFLSLLLVHTSLNEIVVDNVKLAMATNRGLDIICVPFLFSSFLRI